METREFHDALVVGVDPTGKELRLRLERVSVYEGDRLVRQEGGVLRLEGVHDSRVDGLVATPRLQLEYGSVLDWALDNGAGRSGNDLQSVETAKGQQLRENLGSLREVAEQLEAQVGVTQPGAFGHRLDIAGGGAGAVRYRTALA